MKILVIGHSVEDHIHQNNAERIKPGGIYYSVLGLTKIIAADDEIHLITALQKNNKHLFSDIYNTIYKKYISWIDEIPRVQLIINDSEERTECYENVPQNLKINYSMLHGFDGILINMISGFDITLEQLQEIRKNFSGLIYLDVHTLSRGFDENRLRVFRRIENFSKWAASVDLIQVNELEAITLFNHKEELKTANEVMKQGTKCLIVTKGDGGAIVYFPRDNEIESVFMLSKKVQTLNKVGCGDIFGAVFFYSYLMNKNVREALMKANLAAGKSVSTQDLKELRL